MNLPELVTDVFMVIGMVVCVVVSAIALVYGVCYFVRILIKTFGLKVSSTFDIISDDIKAKNIAKKERNSQKRMAKNQEKNEKLRLKLESDEEINKMKMQRYQGQLYEKENKVWSKMFNGAPRQDFRENKILDNENAEILNEETKNIPEVLDENQTETQSPVFDETQTFDQNNISSENFDNNENTEQSSENIESGFETETSNLNENISNEETTTENLNLDDTLVNSKNESENLSNNEIEAEPVVLVEETEIVSPEEGTKPRRKYSKRKSKKE